jgi:hypothetical protein
MSFTAEQQAAIDAEVTKQVAAIQASQQSYAAVMAQQHANSLEVQAKQTRLSAIQLAQSTLIANRNNLPVDAREVSAADITAYAESLVAYVNG